MPRWFPLVLGCALLAGCGAAPAPTLPSTSSAAPPVSSVRPLARLVLHGDGIGDLRFGRATEAQVDRLVAATLGPSDGADEALFCEPLVGHPWQRTVAWDVLSVTFSATDGSPTSPRTLSAWSINDAADPPGLVDLPDGAAWQPSFAELWRQPRKDPRRQWAGHRAAFLDSGLMYLAESGKAERPTDVLAGTQVLCD